jgi:hypothetical protein
VISISQDPNASNQQILHVFWNQIFVHYIENCPASERPTRSKWRLIKHNVNKFEGIYQQVSRIHKSGTSLADVLKKAHELYQVKSSKGAKFSFEHRWEIVRGVLARRRGGASQSHQCRRKRILARV